MPSPAEAGPSKPLAQLLPLTRSSSPPLPPRNNVKGLPPTYLNHLRALIHQWLSQQVAPDDGLPSNTSKPERRLWSDHRIALIGRVIWEGAVLPQQDSNGKKKGLLEVDWRAWIAGAANRRRVWQEESARGKEREYGGQQSKDDIVCENGSKNGKEGRETSRGTFGFPGTPINSASRSAATTPSRTPSRTPSIASSSRKRDHHSPPVSFADCMEDEHVEKAEEWARVVRGLKGFEPYDATKRAVKRDDWEIIDDTLPRSQYFHRNPPGAFPQAAFYDQPSPSDIHMLEARLHPPEASSMDQPDRSDSDADLLKPVFCLHFASPLPDNNSTSTLLQRQVSSGEASNRSTGSHGRQRWGSADRNGSGMTIVPNNDDLAVYFVEGRYALPSTYPVSHKGFRLKSRYRNGSTTSLGTDSGTNSFDSVLTERRQDIGKSSNCSKIHHAGPGVLRPGCTAVIGGYEDDVPRNDEVQGRIRVVGGTIVVLGIDGAEEREDMERVFKVLLYTIQVMYIELEFLDALRVPREPDPPQNQQPITFDLRGLVSPLLAESHSSNKLNEGAKGFFKRLGKESKGVWDGLLGRGRRGTNESSIRPEPRSPATHSFATLGLTTVSSASVVLEPMLPLGVTSPLAVARPIDRYLALLSRLEKLLPSSTPGLLFPMPPLLLRVRDEDRIQREKAINEQVEEVRPGFDGLNRQAGTGSTRPPTDGGLALGYRLGGDVKVGLGSLDCDVETFEGWTKLQRVEAFLCVGVDKPVLTDSIDALDEPQLCCQPKTVIYPLWDNDRDPTVSTFLHNLRAELTQLTSCAKEGCEVSESDHLKWWMHAGKRVMLRICQSDEVVDEGAVQAWICCETCGQRTDPRLLSDVAKLFSWGKLLELLLYSNILLPLNRCAHATASPSPLSWHLQTSVLHVSLSVSRVSVYDARLPKLQVGPSVAKRKAGKEAVEGTIEKLVWRKGREKEKETMKGEIKAFFVALESKFTVPKQKINQLEALSGESMVGIEPIMDASETSTSGDGTNKLDSQASPSLPEVAGDLRQAESGLYGALDDCPVGQINDVRRKFVPESKRWSAKLVDWQKRHEIEGDSLDVTSTLPEYVMDKNVHLLPGSSVLVREDEPASLIAYTLSSLVYFTELTNHSKPAIDMLTSSPNRAEEKSQMTAHLHQEKDWIVEVQRRDTPRDLLSLRTLAKKRSEVSMAVPNKPAMSLTPKEASLELSLEPVAIKGQSRDRLEDIVRSISKATGQDPVLSMKTKSRSSSASDHEAISSSLLSLPLSTPSKHAANGPEVLSARRISRRPADGSVAPPSAFRVSRSTSKTVPSSPVIPATSVATTASMDGWSSMTSTFASSFNQLIRLGSDVSESFGSIRLPTRGNRSLASMAGPLNVIPSIDNALSTCVDRPHIHFTYTLEDMLKLSCTVYYAAAFDSLRRRCAIDKSIVQSLRRTDTWDAQGGKSKACFFMTRDKRFIVKELVSKWNVSDTHALLDIAPAYLEHLAGTHNRATALTKIAGLYTVKIHDLQSNKRRAMDLLVMENLFYKQDITQKFDLKGIETRRAVKSAGAGLTYFDADWLEAMSRAPILIHPHAKRVLTEAISLDARFLSSQSIMDYSLLLGLDPSKSELVVGLVDAIGSFNLFKTIESRGKTMMNRRGDVTIIPPDQYRDRFENALKQYFLVCPDKWSKSKRGTSDGLPSLL